MNERKTVAKKKIGIEEIPRYKPIIDKRENLDFYNNYYCYFVFGYLKLCL